MAVGIAFVTFLAATPTRERHFDDPFPALVLEFCEFFICQSSDQHVLVSKQNIVWLEPRECFHIFDNLAVVAICKRSFNISRFPFETQHQTDVFSPVSS